MKYLCLLLSVFLLFNGSNDGFLTTPVKISSLTNSAQVSLMTDEKETTVWESEALLPVGWLKLRATNYLLHYNQIPSAAAAFDGDLDTAADILPDGLTVPLRKSNYERHFALKFGAQQELTAQFLTAEGRTVQTEIFKPARSYELLTVEVPNAAVTQVLLTSPRPFQLFAVAQRAGKLKERILLDFGRVLPVQYLSLSDNRHSEAVEDLTVYAYQTARDKKAILYENVRENLLKFPTEKDVRFVLLEYTPRQADWQKIRIAEVHAYDRNGPAGSRPSPAVSTAPLKDLLGVNGYWGFGFNQYSKFIPPGDGPDRFAPHFAHLRTYHDMTWDVNDPDELIDYEKMAIGQGTPAKEWLNWDTEYGDWKKYPWDIQASLQFFRFADKDWNRPYQSAYNYAYAYAKHFGPTHGNGYICSIEIGNEPWYYDAKIYREILRGMAEGAKAADPKIEIFPCALQAADPSFERKDGFKNYLPARIPPEVFPLLDGINVHQYSYDNHNTYTQKALQPEAAGSVFWDILPAVQWRNKNLPGKKIYLSEWGWDSPGGGEDCTHNQCVNETDAAAFALRGALIAHRLGIDRATWFYYANETGVSRLYARSGLLSSREKGFQPKKTFYAFSALREVLGDLYFTGIYSEQRDIWGYYYGNRNGKAARLVLWRPVMNDTEKITVHLPASLSTRSAAVFDFSPERTLQPLPLKEENGKMTVRVGAVPVVIELE